MESEERWALITEINFKLCQQISKLIDVCEKQQILIDGLEKRVEKLENANTTDNATDNAAVEEYNRYKEFYEKNTKDWGDQYL